MKICAVICEYNPFHNGHLHQLREAKRLSSADAVLCIMSGNFVQRGESAVLDKFTRAKHAVQASADIVVELPTIFATSNAELFAKGAISILSQIPAVTYLCFGAETADKRSFLETAKLLNEEPQEISDKLKQNIASGMSYAKARANAWSELLPNDLLSFPNNILGLEYTRAILQYEADIALLPIPRVGSGYHDTSLQESYSSATAIRTAIENREALLENVPDFVHKDLPDRLENKLDALEKYAVLTRSASEIARVCDCTEGLENAFKKAALEKESLVQTLTSPRYTASRIRRIALQNLLNIEESLIREALTTPLYLRVLAIKKECSEILSALSKSLLPILVRAHDEDVLEGIAKKTYDVDTFSEKVYALLYKIDTHKNRFV